MNGRATVDLFVKVRDVEAVTRANAETESAVRALVELDIWSEGALKGGLHRYGVCGACTTASATPVTQALLGDFNQKAWSFGHDEYGTLGGIFMRGILFRLLGASQDLSNGIERSSSR